MGPGDDVDAHQFANLCGGSGPGVGGGLDGANVSPDHDGDQPAAHVDLADQPHVGRLHHGVRRLDRAHQALGLHHAQSK